MSVKYSEVMERMRKSGKFKNGSAIARALGVTPQAMSSCKKRGELPSALVLKFSNICGVSMDWLLTGKGEMLRESGSKPADATALAMTSGAGLVIRNAEEFEYVRKLVRILRSGDSRGAVAIKNAIDGSLDSSGKSSAANSNE